MRYLSNWAVCGGNRFFAGTLAATSVFVAASLGLAQGLVQYEFTGVVTDNSGHLGVFGPLAGVQINDVFTGRFSYMTGPANPDQQMGDPEIGFYNIADFDIDQAVVAISPFAVGVTHKPGVTTFPPQPPDLGTDGFTAIGTFLAGMDTKLVSLRLEAPYQTVFTDDSLPTSLSLSDFTDTAVIRSIRVLGLEPGTSQIDEGRLTSLVLIPEPSSAVLALLGLGGIALMLRRRQQRLPPVRLA